jgi:hypothetical protein
MVLVMFRSVPCDHLLVLLVIVDLVVPEEGLLVVSISVLEATKWSVS